MVTVDPVVAWIVRAAVAVLLVGAAWPKLRDRAEFAATVENYRILPASLVPAIALVLPLIELGLGLAVLAFRPALLGAAALLALYAGVVSVNLARGRDHIDCGCHFMGQSGGAIDRVMVARNLIIAAAAVIVGIAAVSSRMVTAVDVLSIAGTLAIAGILYAAIEQARINHSRALQTAHRGA